MYKVTREVHIKNGHLELNDLPFSDDAVVNVIIFPKEGGLRKNVV